MQKTKQLEEFFKIPKTDSEYDEIPIEMGQTKDYFPLYLKFFLYLLTILTLAIRNGFSLQDCMQGKVH